jgi:hypothetical protein
MSNEIDDHVAEAWDQEIAARIEDIRSGRVTPIPWEEARRQILAAEDDPEGSTMGPAQDGGEP